MILQDTDPAQFSADLNQLENLNPSLAGSLPPPPLHLLTLWLGLARV
jgi:hypothetical protein